MTWLLKIVLHKQNSLIEFVCVDPITVAGQVQHRVAWLPALFWLVKEAFLYSSTRKIQGKKLSYINCCLTNWGSNLRIMTIFEPSMLLSTFRFSYLNSRPEKELGISFRCNMSSELICYPTAKSRLCIESRWHPLLMWGKACDECCKCRLCWK